MLVNFGWLDPGRVAGMGLPPPEGWGRLREEGIGAVLSLTEHPAAAAAADHGLVVGHVPLVDFGTPSDADLKRCVDFISAQLDAGRAVAVHCFAGLGRTGTVLAAWRVLEGRDPDEAIAEVRARRPGSLETRGQEEAVRRFARLLRGEAP